MKKMSFLEHSRFVPESSDAKIDIFYKNYSTLSALAEALGVERHDFNTTAVAWTTDILTWMDGLPTDSFVHGKVMAGWWGWIIGYNYQSREGAFIVLSYNGTYAVMVSGGNVTTSLLV